MKKLLIVLMMSSSAMASQLTDLSDSMSELSISSARMEVATTMRKAWDIRLAETGKKATHDTPLAEYQFVDFAQKQITKKAIALIKAGKECTSMDGILLSDSELSEMDKIPMTKAANIKVGYALKKLISATCSSIESLSGK